MGSRFKTELEDVAILAVRISIVIVILIVLVAVVSITTERATSTGNHVLGNAETAQKATNTLTTDRSDNSTAEHDTTAGIGEDAGYSVNIRSYSLTPTLHPQLVTDA